MLKKSLVDANAAVCGRMKDIFSFPGLLAQAYAYERNEQGDITPEMCADIVSCVSTGTPGTPGTGGGGTTPSGTLDTPIVTATKGTYTDHIIVSWGAIANATRYEVYRGSSNNSTLAVKVADINSATSYTNNQSDPNAPLVSGTTYYYFVRAFADTPLPNGSSSSYSQGDYGYEGTLAVTLAGVTDLVASKGLWPYVQAVPGIFSAHIMLTWSAVTNATVYDIYRNTTDDYTTATRIAQDLAAAAPTFTPSNGYTFSPVINNDGTHLAYHDSVTSNGFNDPTVVTNFYYWVVPKKSNPSATGPFSNSNAGALGWGVGQGSGILPLFAESSNFRLNSGGASFSTPATATKVWVSVIGGSASGAGGGVVSGVPRGGGGGGQGASVQGLLAAAAGSKIRVVSVPESDPDGGTYETNGNDGPVTKFQYSADGAFDDTVDIVSCAAPSHGVWNSAGNGAGGAGATATVDGALNPSYKQDGQAGGAAAATKGGDSGWTVGYEKGSGRITGVPGNAELGNAGQEHAGGGAFCTGPSDPALGGSGLRGAAIVVWYA